MVMIKHPTINVRASEEYWRALASQTQAYRVQRGPEPETLGLYVDPLHAGSVDALLLQGITHTQSSAERAIIWVLDEMQRRWEAKRRDQAAEKAANAMLALSRALGEGGAASLMNAILPHLTAVVRRTVREELAEEQL